MTHRRSASPVSPSLQARDGSISPSLLPEALRQSPEQQPQSSPEAMQVSMPEIQLPPSSHRSSSAPVPVGPPPSPSEGSARLLSSESTINADEEYSRDEELLNQFIKLHPMLSMYAPRPSNSHTLEPPFACTGIHRGKLLVGWKNSVPCLWEVYDLTFLCAPHFRREATTSRTLQLVSGMLEKAHVRIPELEEVGKAHDDMFLSEAKSEIGERPCVCGQRCLANHMAKVRYGPDTNKGFVCKEFLLPSQLRDFLDGKGLPPVQQKCLLCSRYWMVRALPSTPSAGACPLNREAYH